MSNTEQTEIKAQKEKKKPWNIKLAKSLMKGRWWLFLIAFVCMLISSAAAYLSPLVIRMTVDSILDGQPMQAPQWILDIIANVGGREVLGRNLWVFSLLVVLLAVLNSVFAFIRGRAAAQGSEDIAKDLRDRMYNHLQHLNFDYHVKVETGDLLQRCSSDVETARRFLAVQVVEIGRIVCSMVLGISIMVALDVQMTLISLGMIPVLMIGSAIYFKRMQSTFLKSDEAEGALSNTVQESLSGIRVVRAFGQQRQEMEKFDGRNQTFSESVVRLTRLMGFFWGLTDILIYIQQAVVMITGTLFVLEGRMSVGTLIAFSSYTGMLLWPCRQLGRILADMGKATVALDRIGDVLDTPAESEEGVSPEQPLSGDIVFDHVTFSYDGTKKVLDDISFTAKQGQTVAILGGTGSGKSTLMYLLQRLYETTEGSITIGGRDIREFGLKWLRSQVGIVLQEPFLYSRSISQNIAITCPDAPEEQVEDVARIAALSDVIKEFDSGYDTVVGERGVTLSGGQKQRVAIARMLIRNTPVLIFDDSLSAVDTQTDQIIRRELKKRRSGATTFIISHRVTTLAEADFILVMEDGRLVDQGTHQELANREGLYQRVWSIQSALGENLEDEDAPADAGMKGEMSFES